MQLSHSMESNVHSSCLVRSVLPDGTTEEYNTAKVRFFCKKFDTFFKESALLLTVNKLLGPQRRQFQEQGAEDDI